MNRENQTYSTPCAIEMLNITKRFGNLVANDGINLQLRRGEIHALLGENGAGKSTLMSILFGLYEPDEGQILKDGNPVKIKDPNDANRLGIGMVHQHFRLVEVFSVLDNIILGAEPNKLGFLQKRIAREKIQKLSDQYKLNVKLNAKVEDITVGMQQRTEILKMLYRDNDILIFDEPTSVLTPQEIEELMIIMKNLAAEGKSILFITHKLNEIMAVADRCSVLRKGKYIGTVDIKDTTKEELSEMMVGRHVNFAVDKADADPKEKVLTVQDLVVKGKKRHKNLVDNLSLHVRAGEIVGIAGIDGNGQSELVSAITGLIEPASGSVILCDENVTQKSVRYRNTHGLSHIPEDRHKHGLILDFTLEQNMVLQRYFEPQFGKGGLIRFNEITSYSDKLIDSYDVRSGEGSKTIARSMSGGNQQKAIIAREIDREHKLLIAVNPTRGLDVGAIEFIHRQIVASRDRGAGVLLVSFELDEIMNLSDRILVMFEGRIVGELDPKKTTANELGLYMAGATPTKEEEDGNEEIVE